MNFLEKLEACGKATVEELSLVERVILEVVRTNHSSDTLKCLMKGAKNDLVSQYSLYGILRCYGRYEQAELSSHAKAATLLPFKNLISNLIINIHCQLFHASAQATSAELRQNFWC